MAQSISVQDFNNCLSMLTASFQIQEIPQITQKPLKPLAFYPRCYLAKTIKNLDPKKLYYILSYTGRRSEALADQLTANGFRAVYIIGGMEALQSSVA